MGAGLLRQEGLWTMVQPSLVLQRELLVKFSPGACLWGECTIITVN